jgi:hypothetical protein
MSRIPPHLAERVQRRIDALETDGITRSVARACKEELNALPVAGNQVYLWALRADGTVFCMDHEAFTRPVEEERDPVKVYAAHAQAARQHPELAEIVPPLPNGVEPCPDCGATGYDAERKAACWGCDGLGWRMRWWPVDEWMERIDRGDVVHLRPEGGGGGMFAGRIAGFYVSKGEGMAYSSAPADDRSRRALSERVKGFVSGRFIVPAWRANPTEATDPFESMDHVLVFSGRGSGGPWETEFVRLPDGRYTVTDYLTYDFDPAGPASTAEERRSEISADSARAAVEGEMRRSHSPDPFPAIVPRTQR